MAIIGNEDDVIVTDDTEHIRDWVEEHNGKPAMAPHSSTEDVKIDIIFEDEDNDDSLEVIPWEEFFMILDEKDLSFAYVQNAQSEHLSSQLYDFKDRPEANTEMEEPGVYGNTLETTDDKDQ